MLSGFRCGLLAIEILVKGVQNATAIQLFNAQAGGATVRRS